jgi:hypothetical protein
MVITEIKGSLLKSHRKPFILLPIINNYHEPLVIDFQLIKIKIKFVFQTPVFINYYIMLINLIFLNKSSKESNNVGTLPYGKINNKTVLVAEKTLCIYDELKLNILKYSINKR